MAERKNQDVELIAQCIVFLFASNHLPLWIEPEDRRYYLIELDHDGHAAGPRAREFADLVARLKVEMKDDEAMAALYLALLQRGQAEGFSAKTLNVIEDATPLMKRVQGASVQTNLNLLREYLAENTLHAIPERDASQIVREHLGANPNSTRHLMSNLGWTSSKAKWDGAEFSRSVWCEKGFHVAGGDVQGPEGFREKASDHFARRRPVLGIDF